MAKDYLPGLSRKKTWRDSDPFLSLLTAWKGKNIAANDIIHHLPEAEPLKNGIDKALKKLVNAEIAFLRKMKDEWSEIAGTQLSKFTFPASFYKGILYVEVSHPAWLMQLGKTEKTMLKDKIQNTTGNKLCKDIKLVPIGKNNRK